MNKEQIQQEFDAFFYFPDGSNKKHVTSASAKLFAEHVARKMEEKIVAQRVRIDLLEKERGDLAKHDPVVFISGLTLKNILKDSRFDRVQWQTTLTRSKVFDDQIPLFISHQPDRTEELDALIDSAAAIEKGGE